VSLQDRLDQFPSPLAMLNAPPPAGMKGAGFPYPPVHTNWRDEQRAWAETALLLHQSFHMSDLYITGPDAIRLLSETSANSYANFDETRGKQYLAVNSDGQVVGDSIAIKLSDGSINVAGLEHSLNWLEYHAEVGRYDVEISREPASMGEPGSKRLFRYELEGPVAWKILEKAAGRKLDPIGFFRVGLVEIAGVTVSALNHTMGGVPGAESTGLELFGPAAGDEAVLGALVTAGEEFGMLRGGAVTYASTIIEGGWIGAVVPAIYTSPDLRAYREWLPETALETLGLFFAGSFAPSSVESYYSTPWELGYGHMIKFDHDFIGRDALERIAAGPTGHKAWFLWNTDDAERVLVDGELRRPDRPRPFGSPMTMARDAVLDGDTTRGHAIYHGYTENIRRIASLGTVGAEVQEGDEVEILWGDADGGASNPFVTEHTPRRVRATVSFSSPAH
jgi:glycine cleavage system aminomethyltransferase T